MQSTGFVASNFPDWTVFVSLLQSALHAKCLDIELGQWYKRKSLNFALH